MDYVQECLVSGGVVARDSRSLTPAPDFGQLVVLYRTSSGGVAALEDACPHRLAPLSMGRLKGDAIECGYHG